MPDLEAEPDVESAQDVDQQVRFQSATVRNGQPVTIVRDAKGRVAFPTVVPPETESPTSLLSPRSATSAEPVEGACSPSPPQSSGRPRKAKSDPIDGHTGQPRSARPSMDKKFVTEMPRQRERRVSILPPGLRRAGTNISQLNRALSDQRGDSLDESSSSSSTSEDEADAAIAAGDGTATGRKKSPPQKRIAEDQYRRFRVGNENYRTKGKVSRRDGRLNITVKDTSNTGYLAQALGAAVRKVVPLKDDDTEASQGKRTGTPGMSSVTVDALEKVPCPKLNIVIMVIGSRGDAQPFLKIGKILKEQYGHRVRIATHPAFREFVERDSGLEFFSVGGDPSELMAFMVKNPGMIPTLETVKAGDIGRRRSAMAEMFEGFWRSCINSTDDEKDTQNLKMMGEKDPFVADAIIANPPSFAHVHCAEALGIPLHLMFTFPYTPTQAFPHPMASIKKSNVDPGYTNFISYPLVEMMVWQGLGDLVNDFRVKTLGLDPVSTLWAPGTTYRLHVPFTYLWSPGLVPKPEDWGEEVDISGFVFLDLASSFQPPKGLSDFLSSGEAPIYIGFGSIVVDDPARFTEMIFEAVKLAGVRALVSKGWGGLGNENVPDNVYMLENTPHDWLFPRVRACVIHGGAGTTAIALKCGKPTMIVPFFGDQHFWGSMVSNAKAGPKPVPHKDLTADKLAKGIEYCLTEEAQNAAGKIAKDIELEGDGAENACKSFHQHLNLSGKHSMRCSILEDMVAVWRLKKTNLRLSALAADVLVEKGYISWRKLRPIRHNEWNDFGGPGEPVTGVAGSLMSSIGDVFGGIGGVPYRLAKSSNERRERQHRKRKRKEKQKARTRGVSNATMRKQDSKDEGKKSEGAPNAAPRPPNDAAPKEDPTALTKRGSDQADIVSHASTVETPENNPAEDFVTHVGRGVGKSASALARAPVDLSLALAQGFHNAPRLYGDDTVRRPIRVTGIRSGLRAARQEFVFGLYDGFTGLVRLPARGARSGGVRGFVKGCGMGVTGFFLKDAAALVGPIGYTFKGLVKQADRPKEPNRHIRRARIMQGQRDIKALGSPEERKRKIAEVERGWDVMRSLWQALEEERKRDGLKAVFGSKRKRVRGEAFESVRVAERALAAIRRGDTVESVVGGSRQSTDLGLESVRRSADRWQKPSSELQSSLDKGRNSSYSRGNGEKQADVAQPIEEDEKNTDKRDRTVSSPEKVGEVRREKIMNGWPH